MFVDIDDLRAKIRSFAQEAVEELYEEEEPYLALVACHFGKLEGYRKVEDILDEMEEVYLKQGMEHNCEWIKYDSWTICPKYHDANNPYWRIPENTDKLKYCPYCGKKITIVKEEGNEE